jgi:hypothetical protein
MTRQALGWLASIMSGTLFGNSCHLVVAAYPACCLNHSYVHAATHIMSTYTLPIRPLNRAMAWTALNDGPLPLLIVSMRSWTATNQPSIYSACEMSLRLVSREWVLVRWRNGELVFVFVFVCAEGPRVRQCEVRACTEREAAHRTSDALVGSMIDDDDAVMTGITFFLKIRTRLHTYHL